MTELTDRRGSDFKIGAERASSFIELQLTNKIIRFFLSWCCTHNSTCLPVAVFAYAVSPAPSASVLPWPHPSWSRPIRRPVTSPAEMLVSSVQLQALCFCFMSITDLRSIWSSCRKSETKGKSYPVFTESVGCPNQTSSTSFYLPLHLSPLALAPPSHPCRVAGLSALWAVPSSSVLL